MQRRNREINIFSMSALDLFASALGAFVRPSPATGDGATDRAIRAAGHHHQSQILRQPASTEVEGFHAAIFAKEITRRNGSAKEIHTVALGDYRENPSLVTFLENLAKANRGGFVGVSN